MPRSQQLSLRHDRSTEYAARHLEDVVSMDCCGYGEQRWLPSIVVGYKMTCFPFVGFRMTRIVVVLFLVLSCSVHGYAQTNSRPQKAIVDVLRQEIVAGHVVGAQVLVGSTRSRTQAAIHLGTVGPTDSRPVSDQTIFCIASCSKPIASAVVFSLLDSKKLDLNRPASELIPELKALTTVGGAKARSPILRELLSHRGGVYSQMQKPSKEQLAAIRDFRLTLDESVQIIARQPLLTQPGTKYAYSGAGYMLVGMMAEKATSKRFETLLQERICKPLRMTSTTYFPNDEKFDEIAMGGKSQLVPPHSLDDQLQLPLVGGSIYSTATDLERFARMILSQGQLNRKQVLSKKALTTFVSPAFSSQAYGHGWLLTRKNGRVVALSHKGSLPPYQCAIRINLQDKTYKIALWTLAKPVNVQATIRIKATVDSLLK